MSYLDTMRIESVTRLAAADAALALVEAQVHSLVVSSQPIPSHMSLQERLTETSNRYYVQQKLEAAERSFNEACQKCATEWKRYD